jgi:alpha-tubulin suppressor-like RCC1 family protein
MIMGCSCSVYPGIVNFPEKTKITIIAAGLRHTIAGDSSGRLYAWGSNEVSMAIGINMHIMHQN